VGVLWARRTLVPVPRLASPFIVALHERGSTAIHGRRPRSGRVSDRETDPDIRPGDHIPNRTLPGAASPTTGTREVLSGILLQIPVLMIKIDQRVER
jgi:hypothetical protein